MRTKISFVLQEALGWKTFRGQLSAVLETRDDIEPQFISPSPLGWRRAFLKRAYMRPHEKIYRQIDPIVALQGGLGAKIRAELDAFGPSAAYFGGHWLAGAINQGPQKIPFAVATDHTRASMRVSLSTTGWSDADLAREARLFRDASHVFPMSDWTAASLRKDCGVDSANITVMYPSIDISRFVRPAYQDEGKLRLVFIGNNFLRKGGDKLCQWVGGPLAGKAELHVISGDPDARGDLPGVIFHGRVPNDKLVKDVLPSMDALCLPTKSDMSPLAIIEAAAAGLPVVASRIGAIPELVLEGETGFVVNAEDEAGFIAALENLAVEPELRRSMGLRAWDHARSRFDASVNFNALIDQLIALGQGRPHGKT